MSDVFFRLFVRSYDCLFLCVFVHSFRYYIHSQIYKNITLVTLARYEMSTYYYVITLHYIQRHI